MWCVRSLAAASRRQTSWPPSWKYDVISKIWLSQSMRICLRNNPAKFHPDPSWNEGALSFFLKCVAPTRTTRSSDVWFTFHRVLQHHRSILLVADADESRRKSEKRAFAWSCWFTLNNGMQRSATFWWDVSCVWRNDDWFCLSVSQPRNPSAAVAVPACLLLLWSGRCCLLLLLQRCYLSAQRWWIADTPTMNIYCACCWPADFSREHKPLQLVFVFRYENIS